jgi:hypothetical protein
MAITLLICRVKKIDVRLVRHAGGGHGGLKVRRVSELLSFADVLRIEEDDNFAWIVRRAEHAGVG